MTKLKKIRIKFYSAIGIVCLLLVIGAGIYVQGYSSQEPPQTVMENVNIETYNEVQPVSENTLAGVASPEWPWYLRVYGHFSYGASLNATTTTATTYTVEGDDLARYHMVDIMQNVGAATFTLPATSTMMGMLPAQGLTREWRWHNATSSSAITLTFAAGTGMDMVTASGTDSLALQPGDWGKMTCSQIYYRSANNENIMCEMERLFDAD